MLSIYNHRALATAQADERMALTHEVVGGLSAMKLQAWQSKLASRIQAIRAREIRHLKWTKLLNAVDGLTYAAAPLIAVLVAFSTFAYTTDRVFAPATIFSSFLLFMQLQVPFVKMSGAARAFVDAEHGLGRLDSLLRADRRRSYLRSEPLEKVAVSAHASFVWPTVEDDLDRAPFELRLDLDVQPGELVAIVGAVKTGKSAICAALTDSMTLRSGSIAINGSVVSVGQHSYIAAGASVRDQIVFDLPFDRSLLDNVLHSTCLDVDLQSFEHGEQSVRESSRRCPSRSADAVSASARH